MKKEFIDIINLIAKDIPTGEVNSVGLEEDVIDIYNILRKKTSSHEILLEQACFLATKHRIEKHLENKKLNEIECRRRVRHQHKQGKYLNRSRLPSTPKQYHGTSFLPRQSIFHSVLR